MVKLGEIYRKLVDEDFVMLEFFVRNLRRFEYIPVEYLAQKLTSFTPKELDARLRKLTGLKVIERHPTMNAYKLKSVGLDCVALRRMVKRGLLRALGDMVGVGKESDIYRGLTDSDEIVVVKFYRIGRTSFRQAVRVRGYGLSFERGTWLVRSVIAGRREREALKVLNEYRVPQIPKLYGGALHAVVIQYLEGPELYEVKELENPREVLEKIIEAIRAAYWKAKIVHGDLSEYNIIMDLSSGNEEPYIIDWPQFVTIVEPTAKQLLERDVRYIVRFFDKRFGVEVDLQEVLKYVLTPME